MVTETCRVADIVNVRAAVDIPVDVLLLEDLLLYGELSCAVVSPVRPTAQELFFFLITLCTVIRGLPGLWQRLSFSCDKTKKSYSKVISHINV